LKVLYESTTSFYILIITFILFSSSKMLAILCSSWIFVLYINTRCIVKNPFNPNLYHVVNIKYTILYTHIIVLLILKVLYESTTSFYILIITFILFSSSKMLAILCSSWIFVLYINTVNSGTFSDVTSLYDDLTTSHNPPHSLFPWYTSVSIVV
jgi:hypothetical protein